VPAGRYLTGSIRIGSNTTLQLDDNAVILGSPNADDYPLAPLRFEGETVPGHHALIWAQDAKNITIQGPGTLQGDDKIGDLRRPRAPVMIELENCHHILLQDFKDRYRRMWSIHLLHCSDVQVTRLNIRTTQTNGDGIDVDSTTHVRIEDCDIDTGDDCISLKSGRGAQAMAEHQPTSDIYIARCTLGSKFAGVGIGTEMSGGVSDVRIENCKFTHGDNAIFLKSRLGRGGYIQNISVDKIDTSSKTCLGINLINKGIVGADPVLGSAGIPAMRNISVSNVTIHSGILVDGLNTPAEKPIENLSLSNVTGNCKTGISLANVVHAKLSNIQVTGFTGPLLVTQNVTGEGLDGAVRPGVADINQLQETFEKPPASARPMVRWWWFGPAVTQPEIKREITAMKAGGFGGFEVEPTYPLAVDGEPPGLKNLKFLSPEFLDDLKFTAATAKDEGMRMDVTMGSGWPYGGPEVSLADAAGCLRVVRANARAGQSQVALRDGESLIAEFPDNASRGGLAGVNGPAMSFISSHTGMKVKRPANGAEGYVLDHLSQPAVARFIENVVKKEIEACGPNIPHSIFCDSLEVGGEDWTGNFLSEFQKRRGYDLTPLLPALVDDTIPRAADIRRDWGLTLTELFNDSFVKPMRSVAEDYNSQFRIQAYGSPSAGLFSYGDADLPEGEGYQWHGYRATRYASSACHLMGVNVCSSETFTWIHPPVFRATPLDIKGEADLHFLQGVNQLVCHGWPYTAAGVADPGWSFYVGGVFDDKNPWYIAMPDVNRYLTRTSGMLRQGRPANDVAVYLDNDDAWAHFSPGHISLTDNLGKQLGDQIVGRILDAGCNLDFFDQQMLARFGRFESGSMIFGDNRYKVIVLPGVERIPLALMQQLETFARSGGVVIATRSIPSAAPGYLTPAADSQAVADIASRLFTGPAPLGLFVEDESQFAAALATRFTADVRENPPVPQLGIVHRQTDFAEIYFVANTSNKPITTRATFRVEGMSPQQWNPVTGAIASIAIADRPPGGTSVDITLDAYESTFIVFSHLPSQAAIPATRAPAPPDMDLSDDWTVQFDGDTQPKPLAKIGLWTDDPARIHYSGVCTFARHFTLTPDRLNRHLHQWLDFGQSVAIDENPATPPGHGFAAALVPPVREVAVITVNGHRAGALWCAPYRLDIGGFLVAGDNTIQIDVANTAVNAIAEKGFPNYDAVALKNQFGNRFPVPAAKDFTPVPSGLTGPVRLTCQDRPWH
jgi:hypothetical protein